MPSLRSSGLPVVGLTLFALLLLLGCVSARADTITSFEVAGTGTFTPGGLVNGTLSIDITTGVVVGADLDAEGIDETNIITQDGRADIFFADGSLFAASSDSFVDYDGSTFDLIGPNDVYTGTVSAVTPEPDTAVLSLTGILLGCVFFHPDRSSTSRRVVSNESACG